MAEVKVRRLPDWVVAAYRMRAEQAGRSLEEELRVLLTEAVAKPQRDCAAKISSLRKSLRRKYGTLSDSTALIREDRQTRG